MSQRIFYESQRFNQWWIYLIMIVIFAFMLYDLVIELSNDGANVASNSFGFFVLAGVAFLLNKMVLKTKIDESGIHIRFWPFYIKEKTFDWENIARIEVKKYSPLADFGGWGYRIGFGGKGKALNVKGNMGIQLQLKNGNKILIGTQKAEEVEQIIELYRRKTEG